MLVATEQDIYDEISGQFAAGYLFIYFFIFFFFLAFVAFFDSTAEEGDRKWGEREGE